MARHIASHRGLAAAAALCALPIMRLPSATGQCTPQWLSGDGFPGVGGIVYAVTTWDPDGSSPQPPLLVVGGGFSIAGNLFANSIGGWDGTSWQPFGSGMGGPGNSWVYALTVYTGGLIAGGGFTTAGGVSANSIARWDGTTWHPLGSGMNGAVRALTVYNGELIAGGSFTAAGGVVASRIARWNGTSWQPLGSGVGGTTSLNVYALSVYNGELIAGGHFTTAGGVSANHIARWDGTTWQPLGSGMGPLASDTVVYALTVYDGELIAGGHFTTAGGVSANYIARWDGTSWQSLGSGMGPLAFNTYVYALTVKNGELIAGGNFTTAGGISANYIARWDDTGWHPLGTGMNGPRVRLDGVQRRADRGG